jgi:hypothetical protein
MPRYLRWTASITAGIVIQFALQVLILAIAVGGNPHKKVTINGASGALLTFGTSIINVIAALAVNDWLSSRYPIERPAQPAAGEPDRTETRAPGA